MRFNASSLLFVAASAAHGGVVPKDVGAYTWDVTQWQAGLSHGNPATPTTSWYAFNFSSPEYGSPEAELYIPAFGARCTGSGAGIPLSSEYSQCATNSERRPKELDGDCGNGLGASTPAIQFHSQS
ncbi:hypothetical protein F4802DRAFT_122043 [Xylaria palmicola]|nr:hypothetical protein F4802DRAFT_122043 [Xylaria palmicola]